jgi:hypothetical protein
MTDQLAQDRNRLAACIWWPVIALITVTAHLLGSGPLQAPPWGKPLHLLGWWERVGPTDATFALLRVAVVAGGLYLLGLGLLGLALQLTGWSSVVRLLGLITTPGIRQFLGGAGITLLSLGSLASGGLAGGAWAAGTSGPVAPNIIGPAPVLQFLPPSTAVSNPPTIGQLTPTNPAPKRHR